jgi:hypothetical protein
MAGSAMDLNNILDEYMFQVVGSTPESIRDSVKTSGLKGNPGPALKVAAASLFASAVNKSTLEGFIAKPAMQDARGIVLNSFSISGRTNMTGMTLLGHCILTTVFAGNVNFAREFRKKMGQDHLWAGDLTKGSLSDKQKEIMLEKKRVTVESSARLLGSGFLKYTQIENTAMNSQEAAFWGEIDQSAVSHARNTSKSAPGMPSGFGPGSSSEAFPKGGPKNVVVPISQSSEVTIPEDIYDYYNAFLNVENDPRRLTSSINKRGINGFIKYMKDIMAKSPNGENLPGGGSVVG